VRRVATFSAPDGNRLRVFGDAMDEVLPERTQLNGIAVQASIAADYLEIRLPDQAATGELKLETVEGEHLLVRLVD
jgi:hypothetical protein